MTNGWKQTTIGEEATLQRGFDISKKEQRPGCVPVVSSGGISSYHDTAKQSAPGVVMGRKGTLGSVFFVDKDYWPHSTSLWVKDFHGNLPRFVFYFFKNMSAQLLDMDVGAANPSLNRNHVHPLEINWPPLPEQKAIAHILGSLDDKIELNRRMNETLEGLAQALFKSWFTDFDPVLDNAILADNSIPDEFAQRAEVRRKVLAQNQPSPNLSQGEMGFPDLGKDAADFPSIGNKSSNVRKNFPDSFQPSELGPIPTGWDVSTFGDVAKAIRDSVNPSSLDADVPYVGLEHIGRKQMYLSGWGYAGDVDSNKSAFQTGDVLFGKLRPYFHKVCIMNFAGICSTDILVFRAKEDCWKGFVQYQLFDEEFVEYANARSTGTRMPRASWKDMVAYSIAKPSDDIAAHFTELIEGFNAKAMLNVESSSKLARLRDTLLPKLISGGIGCLRNE